MGVRAAGWAMLVAFAAAQGQAAQDPAAFQDELKKLGAAAQSLQRDLPSFTCTETGLSQVLKKGKVKAEVRFVANVRVNRAAVGRLDEELEVSEVNGKPARGRFEPPFMVGGGFGESLFYFLPASQDCFVYTLSAGRVDFGVPPGSPERARCMGMGSPKGFALLDEAGNPTHLERQVPHDSAEKLHIVDSSVMDFVPMELDGKMYSLTTKMVADEPKDDGLTLHFEATYAACHLFKATSRILPDVTPVPDLAGPHP